MKILAKYNPPPKQEGSIVLEVDPVTAGYIRGALVDILACPHDSHSSLTKWKQCRNELWEVIEVTTNALEAAGKS